MAANQTTDFQLEKLESCFNQSIRKPGNVEVQPYLEGLRELVNLFVILGEVFGWMAHDLDANVRALSMYGETKDKEHYADLRSLLNHEANVPNLIRKTRDKDGSGARRFLRLHRTLKFAVRFLEAMSAAEKDERLCVAARKAYEDTVGKQHSCHVQRAARMAMELLPTKAGTVEAMYGPNDPEGYAKCSDVLPRVVRAMTDACANTEKLYKEMELHDLA